MTADGLVTQGAKASAAMPSTYLYRNIPVSATQGLIQIPTMDIWSENSLYNYFKFLVYLVVIWHGNQYVFAGSFIDEEFKSYLRRAMNSGTRITGQLRQPTTSLHTWLITWDIKGCQCLF